MSTVLLAASLAGAVDEPMIAPVDGVFRLEGRGFGHGRGMSQWGAQGAAVQGVGYREILSTYYPGTRLVADSGNRRLRVLLTADRDGDLRVAPASGLVANRGRSEVELPKSLDGRKVTQWRVRLEAGRLELAGRAGEWLPFAVGSSREVAEPLRLRTSPSRGVRLILGNEQREYRGDLRAYRNPATGRLAVVNGVRLESYLRSVVPSEAYSTWRPAALAAQSVAARTYARWRARNVAIAGGVADICDTTACQAYRGARRLDREGRVTRVWEAASTDAAISATAGQYLRYGGAEALTEYSSSNGGYSAAGDRPYLLARPDPWDGAVPSRAHAWTADLDVPALTRRFPKLGRILGLVVRDRDGNGQWGGRVLLVRVVGEFGSTTLPGTTFAKAVALRHSWWQVADGGAVAPAPTPGPSSPQAPQTPQTPEAPDGRPRPVDPNLPHFPGVPPVPKEGEPQPRLAR
ncbi:MAG: SpoIID/LytB domain-containing protein [Sporichthyaceae bacterium]